VLNQPAGVALNSSGNLYISDSGNSRIGSGYSTFMFARKALIAICGFQKLWPHRFQKFCPPQGGAEWGNSITELETQVERHSHIQQSAGMVVLN
jgi:hypothetical protein